MTNHPKENNSTRPPPPPPLATKPTKKQALLLLQQERHEQKQFHEPWLFQSVHIAPSPWASATPLPSLGASTSTPTLPFYLDVESLRTLLPASGRRARPRSSGEPYGSPQARAAGRGNQRNPIPVRLEALSSTAKNSRNQEPAAAASGTSSTVAVRRSNIRRRKLRAKSARPTSVHRKLALRIDAAKARQAASDSQHLSSSTTATKSHSHHHHSHHHHSHHHAKQHAARLYCGSFSLLDDDADADARADTPPPPPLDDLAEARREKTAIAEQLGLTLDEYEALDAAFGDKHGDASDEQGGMTERYHAVFARYDVDGSGAISPGELRGLLTAAGEDMDDAELSKVIAQADTDGDGEIDFDEFMALMRARKRLLLVASTMGVSGTGPSSAASKGSVSMLPSSGSGSGSGSGPPSSSSSLASPLPPLKLAVAPTKRHLQQQAQFNRHFSRPTPTCLRPGAQVDVTQLRRELAIAEFGIQELNLKVRDGVHWVQQHCPVNSLKAQIYCHRWGMEKVHALLLRLQSQSLSRAYQKWKAFLVYERNKVKANLFLKCKGSQKLTHIMAKWTRKTLRRRFAHWKRECAIDARNEALAAVVELQRAWRGKLARLWRFHGRQRLAATTIQALVRGRLGRRRVHRLRRARLEHGSACVLQRCYRGYNGKRLAKALFKAQQETLAARRIQRAFRNHQRRRLLRAIQRTKLEHDSAVQLQCCMRSFLARRERRARAHQRRRARGSVVIQRHTRGMLARRHVSEQRRRAKAAVVIQTRCRAFRSRWQFWKMRHDKADRERRERERMAATAIQARWRTYHAHTTFVAHKTALREAQLLLTYRRLAAALRIQRVFRGFCARRRAQRLRYEKLKWMNVALMNRCALRIQACWRGFHGRLASQLRLQAKRAMEHEETLAARRIQAVARGKLARGELVRRENHRAQMRALQHKRARAALQIQKIFRGEQARKRAAELQQAHRDQARAALDRLVLQAKTRAAIKIQCCVRVFLAHARYRARKLEMERRKLESGKRMRRQHAAVVIQCAMRRARARRALLLRRREFEKRISLMASEKAYDEIERLREEQEAELARLRVQLLLQESKATEESAKLRKQLEAQQQQEDERREQEAQELAKLKLEVMMQQHTQASERKILEHQRQQDAERLREQLEREIKQKQAMEELVRTQENEELAKLKMTALLKTTTKASAAAEQAQDTEAARLEHEAAQLERAAVAMKRDQARMKIRSVCLKHIAKRRIQRLQTQQAQALAELHTEEERIRVRALQEKEMALAKLKAMMDDEARAREQEIKALEAQMLERARLEKARIAKRNTAARKIQASARGYLDRARVKAIQRKIEKEREERAKALEDQLAAVEAKMAAVIKGEEVEGDGVAGAAEGAEAAASGSPEDWVEYWDENAQASYFYNIKTQEASWTRPFSAPNKAMVIAMAATAPTVDYEGDPYAGGYAQGDASGYSAAGYADEYGFYDQYGQYHYYDNPTNAANTNAYQTAGNAASMQAAMASGMMYPGYAAAAAAYAYQAAMAFGGNAMMYGAAAYNQPMANPMMMTMGMGATTTSPSVETAGAEVGEYAAAGDQSAVPPDPWEKFFDQYTGAAYYYNSITGEKYWA